MGIGLSRMTDRNRYVIIAQDDAKMVEGIKEAERVASALQKRSRNTVQIYLYNRSRQLILVEEVE